MLETLTLPVFQMTSLIVAMLSIWALWKRQRFALAFRNLIKNRRRTLILMCVMVSGLTGLIEFFGYAEYSVYNLREATIQTGIGHLQVYKRGFNATGNVDKLQYNISDHGEIVESILKDPYLRDNIRSVGVELEFSGIVANERTSSVFFGKGIEVEQDRILSYADELIDGMPLEKANSELVAPKNSPVQEEKGMFDAFYLEGIDPEVPREKKSGPAPSPEKNRPVSLDSPRMDDAIIGQGLSSALQSNPGSVLTLMVATRNGALNAVDVHVRGIIKGFSKEYNDSILKMPIQYAWKLMGRKDVTKISILLKETEMTDACAKKLREILMTTRQELLFEADAQGENELDMGKVPAGLLGLFETQKIVPESVVKQYDARWKVSAKGEEYWIAKEKGRMNVYAPSLEYTTWKEVAINYHRVHAFFAAIFFFMGILITIVVSFSIANAMTMSVMERTREIGILRSLGEKKSGITNLFLIEGMLIGVMGGLLSILVGIGFAEFINIKGIPHPPPPGSTKGFIVFLYVSNRPVIWGVSFLLAFFSAFISSVWPARKASCMQIVDSLRYA